MAFTEKELERKTLSEISSLVLGYEKKIKELASDIGVGQAKLTDMAALNSDLALLKKVQDKKSKGQNRHIRPAQTKSAAPLKSYDDYLKK